MKKVISKCKQYKGVLLIVLLGLAFIVYYLSIQPSNIFDEIYRNELSYLQGGGSIELMKIKGVHIYTSPDSSDYQAGLVSATYKSMNLTTNSTIQISSNKKLMILYWETLEDNIELYLTLDYNPKTKVLKKDFFIEDNYRRVSADQLADTLPTDKAEYQG